MTEREVNDLDGEIGLEINAKNRIHIKKLTTEADSQAKDE